MDRRKFALSDDVNNVFNIGAVRKKLNVLGADFTI